ncbi:flagellar switch protein FliM [Loktanella sp. 5RATIMAR09]|uniref:FliM/FliN family flagellar motor switch protein n=1 Tax=Loktanella sp. 5RATIMAR09 TaxID=1225655 RepID=UPI0006EBAEF2|nr:flagellar motor switch protein FliM [Loktanella sp. 5RATIMAR09]KQI70997.1 flagellar switch protein FliM [Loktanella sp. 5RATIMAR09]
MTTGTQVTLLRRMTRPQGQGEAENPLTSSRAVRLALTKAANDSVGLVLTVESVGEEVIALDDMLATLGADLMLVGLERDGALSGLIALDMEMRAAVLEMETMGTVLARPADTRAPTQTDKALCDPVLHSFLGAFPQAVLGTPLEGWMDGVAIGAKVESARAAGLVLMDRTYRIVRMSVDLGVADRRAQLVIALPLVEVAAVPEAAPPVPVDWHQIFRENVHDAPACLEALLYRAPISLATAQALQVGTVLPLPGCTVNSVRLLSPDGHEVAQAKLGQIGGYRAVRLEPAPAPQLAELPHQTITTQLGMPDVMDVDAMTPPADLPDASSEWPDLPDAAQAPDVTGGDMPDFPDVSFDPDPL